MDQQSSKRDGPEVCPFYRSDTSLRIDIRYEPAIFHYSLYRTRQKLIHYYHNQSLPAPPAITGELGLGAYRRRLACIPLVFATIPK
jgi:hypothetical protein